MADMGKSVFHAQWGELPPHFVGRERERDSILRALLRDRQAPVVVGRRGVGKTCLIRLVEKELKKEGWVVEPQPWSMPREITLNPVAGAVAILDAAQTYARKVSPEEDEARSIGFRVDEDDEGPTSDPNDAGNLVRCFTPPEVKNLLESMSATDLGRFVSSELAGAVTPEDDGVTGLVVILDEFQMFAAGSGVGPIDAVARIIAECRELNLACRFILAGMPIAASIMAEKLGGASDLMHVVRLEHLTEDETRSAIAVPLKEEGIEYEAELIDRIYRDTDGHPKLVQFYAQGVLDLCKEGGRYTVGQYLKVAAEIEHRFFTQSYHELETMPDRRFDALWGVSRAIQWKAEREHLSPEEMLVQPSEVRQFLDVDPGALHHQLEELMAPGSEYVYKAGRAQYGLLKPLLWKRVLRLRGEEGLRKAFEGKVAKKMDPEAFTDPTKAKLWLKRFIAAQTKNSQRVWVVDEYWESSCVGDYLHEVDDRTDIYLVTKFSPQERKAKLIRAELENLRGARNGRVFLKYFEGKLPIKARLMLFSESVGIHSSQSFAHLGQRDCVVTRMAEDAVRVILERMKGPAFTWEEIESR